ncbi:hypothetical protein EJ815_27900, partial [Pseudomonas aeruginosa]
PGVGGGGGGGPPGGWLFGAGGGRGPAPPVGGGGAPPPPGRFVSVVWEFRATLHFYFPAGGGRRRGCLLCPADNASHHSSYPWGGRAGRFQRLLDAPRLRSISTRRYPAAAP